MRTMVVLLLATLGVGIGIACAQAGPPIGSEHTLLLAHFDRDLNADLAAGDPITEVTGAELVDEAGFETDVEGKSVTALEIEFGVLASPEQRRRTRFYFRDPLPYDRMSPEVAAQLSEQHSPEPGAEEAHERLQALKAGIETLVAAHGAPSA